MNPLFGIRPGDRITVRDRFGALKTGRAQALLIFPSHVVLNMGGRYGTPQVADRRNIVSINGVSPNSQEVQI